MKQFQVQFALIVLWGFSSNANPSPREEVYGRRYSSGNENNRVIFPSERERYVHIKDVKREVNDDACCGMDDIPLELALQLGNITDSNELFNSGLIDSESFDQRILTSGFGERSGGEVPKSAGCNTVPTIVHLRPEMNKDPRLVYSPQCTRVERCSGCCVSTRLSCQPTSTRTRTFTVTVLEYVANKLRFKSRDLALIEEHVGCTCQCRVKAEHCNSLQQYNAKNCRCDCMNNADRDKCLLEKDKVWNPDNCLCECTEEIQCTSGSYFDRNYCRCLKSYTSSRVQNPTSLDRRRLILKPVPSSSLASASQPSI